MLLILGCWSWDIWGLGIWDLGALAPTAVSEIRPRRPYAGPLGINLVASG